MEILIKKIEHMIEGSINVSEFIIRTIIVFLQGSLAIAIPSLGSFISLIGAVFVGTLGLFLPAALEIIFLKSCGSFGKLSGDCGKI